MSNLNVLWQPIKDSSQEIAVDTRADETLYCGTRGGGKGLPLSEPVYTEKGVRPIGSLKVGDYVCCPDGSISEIIGVFPQGVRPVYKLTFSDGSTARCDDNHIWAIHTQDGNKPTVESSFGYRLMTIKTVIEKFNKGVKLHIPTLDRLNMRLLSGAVNRLPIDPYLLGLLLGDGSFTQVGRFCTADKELADYVLTQGLRQHSDDKRNGLLNFGMDIELKDKLRKLNLWGKLSDNKFIPEKYLHHSYENRLSLLQGLMDTDGTTQKDKSASTFTTVSYELAKGVQCLARSLGANATLTTKETTGLLAYNVYIQDGGKFIPFRLKRKVALYRPCMHEKLWRKIVDIKELTPTETVCIKIAHPLGLFITNDFVVTHNTDTQLMAFAKYVGMGYGRYWRGIIFDQEYKNLDDVIVKSRGIFGKMPNAKYNIKDSKWTWSTGEELLFRRLRQDSDYWLYHGHQYCFIGFNELTKYPTSYLYDTIQSCNRSGFVPEEHPQYTVDGKVYYLPPIPLMIFSTTNPFGAGHNWVKKRFIDVAPYGTVVKRQTKVFDPKTKQEELVEKTQVALFSSYIENIYLSPKYIASLLNYPDPNIRRAWALGSWDIVSGGAVGDLWNKDKHVINRFVIPDGWYIDRTFDWGSSHPFSVGWWACANGEEADVLLDNGEWIKFCPPKGSLIQFYEWYGTEEIGTNKGLKMSARDIAKGINQIEHGLIESGWIRRTVASGSADNQIWNNTNTDNDCIADIMESENVYWERSNKASGSRVNGLQLFRDMLKNTTDNAEQPHIYFMNNCIASISTIPVLPRDAKKIDDVDTTAEDHAYDMVRYRILDGVGNGSILLNVEYSNA